MSWALIVHGGAREIAPEDETANRRGCLAALEAGRRVLADGRGAVEAVEAAIRVLEDDPTFNAGRGAATNAHGELEFEAALMEGEGLAIGAVAALKGVRHPISVARLLVEEQPVLLAGDGARRFAEARGVERLPRGHRMAGASSAAEGANDTVGCVALDATGTIAAGVSTGGLKDKWPGRVGDSALAGCGFYADSGVGGVSLSGEGEAITRLMLAARIMHRLEDEPVDHAAEMAIAHLDRVGGEAGCIILDARGRCGWAHNSRHFAVAHVSSTSMVPRVFLSREEAAARG